MVLYLLRRQALLRDVRDKGLAQPKSTELASKEQIGPLDRSELPFEMDRRRFATLVLLGAITGAVVAGACLAKLKTVQASGTWASVLIILLGATAGALISGITRAYRTSGLFDSCFTVFSCLPALIVVWDQDWALVRSWGWIWIAFSIFHLAPTVAASFSQRSTMPGLPEVLLSPVCAAVSVAVLFGQIGRQFDGQLGLEVGETAGVLLGFLLAGPILRFLHELPNKVWPGAPLLRQWAGLVIWLALVDGGVLWLLLS